MSDLTDAFFYDNFNLTTTTDGTIACVAIQPWFPGRASVPAYLISLCWATLIFSTIFIFGTTLLYVRRVPSSPFLKRRGNLFLICFASLGYWLPNAYLIP